MWHGCGCDFEILENEMRVSCARLPAAVAVAVALAAAAGCSAHPVRADSALTPPEIRVGADPTSAFAALDQLPLSAYGFSNSEDSRLFAAQRMLTIDCMHARGHLAYSGEDMIDLSSGSDPNGAYPAGSWGYIGAREAASAGFHATVDDMPESSSASDAPMDAATQKDRDSCDKNVDARFTTGADEGFAGKLADESQRSTEADKRVVAATGRWSQCMRAAGHGADLPADGPAGLVSRYLNTQSMAPTPGEIAVAIVTERCTRSAHLASTYFAVWAGYEKQLLSINDNKLTAYQTKVDEVNRAVTDVIANSKPKASKRPTSSK
jgi:hypothetical protein